MTRIGYRSNGEARYLRWAVALLAMGGLLFFFAPSRAVALTERYSVGPDTVVDTQTGLTWQRKVSRDSYTWPEALKYCERLSLAGASDWRSPSIKELQTLVDRTLADPAIDTYAFPETPSDVFWSSSPYAFVPRNAWGINFLNGRTVIPITGIAYRVRCVR